MLDSTTKKRIDDARDTLVGKLPDPKSQVEQITIALIYKFMDDMDRASVKLGGKAKFFSGAFKDYAWDKVFDTKLAGHEVVKAYGDAIQQLDKNPNVPQLFRNILKNAYLPYRDPETLKSFLTIIDEFEYDHSEKLGDAFEYLLSVLGSQGEVGQFRTPRHIIDFIVEVINPQKNEKILDPACGTAGFLISAYKHILKRNSKNYSPERDSKSFATKAVNLNEVVIESKGFSGDKLTSDDRSRLVKNIFGYDISPDMIRLSLVNLYLHGFPDPKIVEYDTLTSEDRWSEYADVILANPPFMSPKGGIKPHKRFSVQSSRSEVLFVDYMLEHLSPTGRAGIIVPEGVIFNGQNAFTQIRKMLVDKYLVAVVSLPAGVFNPYSGVKTSILIIDKALARKATTIAFFKVENDGFDLGAQRRAIDKNDLPKIFDELSDYLCRLRDNKSLKDYKPETAYVIEKAKILANNDCNLSSERYIIRTQVLDAKYPPVLLGDICTFMTGGTPTTTVSEYYQNGTIPWLVSGDIHRFEIKDCEKRITPKAIENSNARILPNNSVLIALNGQGKTRGTVALLRMPGATCNQSLVAITPSDTAKVIPEYIFWVLRSMYSSIRALTGDNERSGLNVPILKQIQIPLPPLEIQKQIVAEISSYQKVIDGARTVVVNYKPNIPMNPEWPTMLVGDILKLSSGKGLTQTQMKDGAYPVYGGNGKSGTHSEYFIEDPIIVIGRVGAYCGAVHITEPKSWITDNGLYVTDYKIDVEQKYIAQALQQLDLNQFAKVGGQPSISQSIVYERRISLPPLAIQKAIVADIESEQAVINANRQLIASFEKKIQATLSRIWEEAEPSLTMPNDKQKAGAKK